jgi:division protein CdvB (Snf7/Vps24/ESCRT-III family)
MGFNMENDEIKNEKIMNEIGYLAYMMDTEMTMFERMKLKKSSFYRILGAMTIYLLVMILFALFL